jgi:hypothetical protein
VTGEFDKSLKLEKCGNRDEFKTFHDKNEARKLPTFTGKNITTQSTVQTPLTLKFSD